MHPPLHAKKGRGCDEVVAALEQCHQRGFLHKCFGGCNQAKLDLNKCLRAERLERTTQHREAARVKREKLKAKFDEIDANS